MKKSIAILLLFCFVVPILLFALNITGEAFSILFPTQVAYASETRTTPYGNSFLQHYFYNLRSNFGENKVGTCGYVAVGMLLSYFDTFWDDRIVPEEYETTATISALNDYVYNSPGAGEMAHLNTTCGFTYDPNDPEEYFFHLQTYHKDDAIQGALIDCMMLAYDQLDFQPSPSGYIEPNSIDPFQAEIIVNTFLSVYSTGELYTGSTYTNLFGNNDQNYCKERSLSVRERIISHVQSNLPVAVYYGSTTTWENRHVAIAYDYDPINDVLYFHMGYRNSQYYYSETMLGVPRSETDSCSNYYYGDLTFFLIDDHYHSNNFILSTTGQSVCSCKLADHAHSYSYELYNSSQHKKLCHCGYETTENHAYRLQGLNYVCRYCKKIYTGTTPPITPVLPVNSNNENPNEWLGVEVVEMEVPAYEE